MKKISNLNNISKENMDLIKRYFSNEVIREGFLLRFEKDEILNSSDQPFSFFLLILSGRVKIYMNHENGNQSIVHFAHKHDFLGELELLSGDFEEREIVAQTSTVCFAIPMAKAKEILLTDTNFLNKISAYLVTKLYTRTNRLTEASNYKLINSLSFFILQMEQDNLYQEKNKEVAAYLNVSYRHLTYTLKKLQEDRIISKVRNGYIILDKKTLQKYANVLHEFDS